LGSEVLVAASIKEQLRVSSLIALTSISSFNSKFSQISLCGG